MRANTIVLNALQASSELGSLQPPYEAVASPKLCIQSTVETAWYAWSDSMGP